MGHNKRAAFSAQHAATLRFGRNAVAHLPGRRQTVHDMKNPSLPTRSHLQFASEPKIVSQLRASSLFRDLGEEVLDKLLPHCRYNVWPAHTLVQYSTDDTPRFHVLLEGRLKVQSLNPSSSRAITLHLLRPGDGYSLLELFDSCSQNVQIETVDTVATVSAPLALWHEWLDAYPALRKAVARMAGKRLCELVSLAEDLALYDAPTRLARLLLRYSDEIGNDLSLFDDLVHEDIAHLIGSVRVVANRLLNRFKQAGIIDTTSGRLHILDPYLLERMATDDGQPPEQD
jgi:CRP-like cAMP-binding protein